MKDPIRAWLRTHEQVITLDEARRLGLSDQQLRRLVGTGAWERIQPRVYRDTSSPRTPRQLAVAAAAAGGERAVISHATAAWLWELLDRPPDRVHLTVPVNARPPLQGVVVHRSRDLDPARTVWHEGVRCTDPLRTLADLGACADGVAVTTAVDRALAKRLVRVDGLRAELGRVGRRGRPGPRVLRGVLLERGFIGGPAPSVLESQSIRLFRGAGIPISSCEHRAGPEGEYRIDFTVEPWPSGVMLALEAHGYVWHFSPEHLARDLARQRRLTLAGWLYLAYSWREITREPGRVVAEVWEAIDKRRAETRTAETRTAQ